MLSGKAKIAGVLGWPVAHSLSPKLHNYWLEQHKIDGVYIPLPVKPDDLPDAIRALPKMGFQGVNLTLPHKELVMEMTDYKNEEAAYIGAANTLVFDAEKKIFAMNTDAYGFIENLRPHLSKNKSKAVILGAGGAARAVCYALMKEGFANITVANRSPQKAHILAELFKNVTAEDWEKRSQLLEGADLLVNATSLGLSGSDALSIDLALLPQLAVVTDIVYRPLITPLLEKARARGNIIVDGLGMLIHQAVPGFEAWFKVKPEVTDDVRNYLLA